MSDEALRELVRDMWDRLGCDDTPPFCNACRCDQWDGSECRLLKRMSELGIELED